MATPVKATPKQPVKASTRTNTGQVAVAPRNTIKVADVKSGIGKINKWLLSKTDNRVDLATIKNYAGAVPVIGNIIALADVVYDVIDISKNRTLTSWIGRTWV